MSCFLKPIFRIYFVMCTIKAIVGVVLYDQINAVKSGIRGNHLASLSESITKNVRLLQQNSTIILFDMYNSKSDTKIGNLSNGTILNLNGLSTISSINIEAVALGTKPVSIKFSFDQGLISKVESGTRYTLCGNSGSDFKSCDGITLGKHTIQAVAYNGKNAAGQVLGSNTVQFELVDIPVSSPTTLGPLPTNPTPVTNPLQITPSTQPVIANPLQVPPNALPVPTNPPPVPANPPFVPTNPPPVPTISPAIPTNTPPAPPNTQPVPTITPPVPTNPQPVPTNPAPRPTDTPVTQTIRPVTRSPINPTVCAVPKLNNTWTSWQKYPISIGEGMGAMVGKHFVIVSGFTKSFSETTKRVFAFDTTNSTGQWQEMDEVPVPGFSHAAFAVDGLTLYICGAYVGPTPGPDSPVCLKYIHTNPPTQQWSRLPDMPDGRGGGALNHIKESNSLLYTAGATRRGSTIDYNTTWELDLKNLTAGWMVRPELPFKANHISHVTALYQGKYHYFVAGGQLKQQEQSGNQDDLYEWDVIKKVWIQRADMRFARGHASSSTVAYGCGFIILGGATNNGTQTDDISYYGIDTNTWVKIGILPKPINTPVCAIVRLGPNDDWVYCQTGNVGGSFSWRTRISL